MNVCFFVTQVLLSDIVSTGTYEIKWTDGEVNTDDS